MTENRLGSFEFAQFQTDQNESGFDQHIANSIQDYASLWGHVVDFSSYFVENNTDVFDLGCSSGKLIKALYEKNKGHADKARYVGVDLEKKFIAEFKKPADNVQLMLADVSKFNLGQQASFITSIFTLQFMPKSDRQAVLNRSYDALKPGGAMVIAEKTISPNAKLQDIMTSTYYEFKRKNFSPEEILDKEKKLRYLMKPVSDTHLQHEIQRAGFMTYQKFWQSRNFVGYLCIKQ